MPSDISKKVSSLVADTSEATRQLRAYYNDDSSESIFQGRWYDRIGREKGRDVSPDRITFDDIFAIQSLSIKIPFATAIELTFGQGVPVSSDLELIPCDVGPLWNIFEKIKTFQFEDGWVTASRLLAHKRPQLVPAYDKELKKFFGYKRGDFWKPLYEGLVEDQAAIQTVDLIDEIRDNSELPEKISRLRCIEVLALMGNNPQTK
jgi:Family of unknown function (DUF6308)